MSLRRSIESHEQEASREHESFSHFLVNKFFPAVREVEGEIAPAPHLQEWAEQIEKNRRSVILAPRGHLKSTLFKGYVAYQLDQMTGRSVRGLYMSYKRELAQEHLQLCQDYIEAMDLKGVRRDTSAKAVIRYRKDRFVFEVKPAGVLEASRGRHVLFMLLDDILKDPESAIKPDTVYKITGIFQRKVIPMIRGWESEIHIAGTPIIEGDIYDALVKVRDYAFKSYPACDDQFKQILWKHVYDKKVLQSLYGEMGAKAFDSEYRLKKTALVGSYISAEYLKQAFASMEELEL